MTMNDEQLRPLATPGLSYLPLHPIACIPMAMANDATGGKHQNAHPVKTSASAVFSLRNNIYCCAAASDANAGAQANVDIGLHLHGITPSCRTRFVGSRPTNENVSMILFGSNKNKKWDQEGLFFTASFNHGDFCVTSNAYYFVCHQPD
jgi:hypothetical protein